MKRESAATIGTPKPASVPEGWELVRLGDIFEQVVDTGHTEDLPVLAVTLDRGVIPRSSLERKFEREVARHQYLRARPGDIAYNTMRMWQGGSGLVREEGYISPAYTVCRARRGENPDFWATAFKSDVMIRAFRAHSQGFAKDRYRLYFNHFASVPALRPSLSEQCKIANILAAVDRASESVAVVADRLRVLLSASARELFAIGLSEGSQLRSLPEGWESNRLRECGILLSGGTPNKTNAAFWKGPIPWISPKDMKATRISGSIDHVSEAAILSGSKSVPAGTILMVVRGMILAHSFPVALTGRLGNFTTIRK
jgi:type I restriction enzyme, S subunit